MDHQLVVSVCHKIDQAGMTAEAILIAKHDKEQREGMDRIEEAYKRRMKNVKELERKLDKAIDLLQYLLDAPGVSPLMQSKIDMAIYEIDENHLKKQY